MSIYNNDGNNGDGLGSVVNLSNINLSNTDFSNLGSGFAGDIGNVGITPDFLSQLLNNPELLRAFQAEFPEDFAQIQGLINTGNLENDYVVTDKNQIVDTGGNVKESMDSPSRGNASTASTGLKKILEEISKAIKNATGVSGTDLTKGLLAAYLAKKAYDEGQEARNYRRGATMGINAPVTATRNAFQGTKYSATGGGIGSLDMAQGRYLGGTTDGMADKIPAHIDNRRPAALSDGEFVIPADVVSHLGNGNSNAGAKRLYEMMDRIRGARTGNTKQGKQINPNKFLPR